MNDTVQDYGGLQAWGSVWRGTLLGAAVGSVLYGLYHTDEDFLEGVVWSAGIAGVATGLWQTGAGMIASARAPRGSTANEAGAVHALSGFFSGVGGGTVLLGVASALSRPKRRRRSSALSPYRGRP